MRLIDADTLLKEVNELENGLFELLSTHSADEWVGSRERFIILTELEDIKIFKETIEEAPTVEIPRGEWIEHEDAQGVWHYDCPFCDDGYAMTERHLSKPNYCGNCGADMRGEGE